MKGVIKSLLTLLFTVATVVALDRLQSALAEKNQSCPSNFVRLSHRCYFFSKEKATWQDAFFQCHSMKSNLAIIKNRNQDKLINRVLTGKSMEPLERWLGGRFDWQRKQWKWAASGKPLSYNGFGWPMRKKDESQLQWNCIVVDPNWGYRWNSRSCLEDKHFICQRKVNSNEKWKNKIAAQQNSSRLNEIPIPTAKNGVDNLKSRQRIQSRHVNPNLGLSKTKKTKKARLHNSYNQNSFQEINDEPYKGRRNKASSNYH